jgi:predicted secreted protein
MAERVGRTVRVYKGAESPADLIEGLREKGIKASGEPLDVTSDDDDGFRKLLSVFGQKQIDVSLSGLPTNDVVKDSWYSDSVLDTWTIEYPNGATLTGQFLLVSFDESEPYNGVSTVSFELQSANEWTYTPASP